MFKGGGILDDAVGVHSRLVGKGTGPYIRFPPPQRDVGHLRHGAGGIGELGQVAVRDAHIAALKLQVRNDGRQVGVSTALAEAQIRALHMGGTRLHRR